MLEAFPELPDCNAKRKQWFKKNWNFYLKNIQKSMFVQKVFEGIRDDMYDKLVTLSHQQLWDYIKDSWMDAGFFATTIHYSYRKRN